MTALRMFLSISAAKQHSIRHYDVDTAFLNAELKEEMYTNPPPPVYGNCTKPYMGSSKQTKHGRMI